MKNIHVLSTDKPSRLHEFGNIWFSNKEPTECFRNYNIYITSDEEIKEGDWCYHPLLKEGSIIQSKFANPNSTMKKIILTTDQDLIKDGVQAIDDEFLEWFVNNPSCEKVKVISNSDYEMLYKVGASLYKIIIPKEEPKTNLEKLPFPELVKEFAEYYKNVQLVEEPKQETLEEAKYNAYKEYWNENHTQEVKSNFLTAFKLGAKWQQERMYSEEEVFNLCREFAIFVQRKGPSYKKQQEWFKQFKKK